MTLSKFTARPRLLAIGFIVALFAVTALVLLKAKAVSYRKIEPFEINLTVQAKPESHVFLAYDYGYGIQDQHIRRLTIGEEATKFSLSVSAWKHVHGLYFISPKDNPYAVSDLTVNKNDTQITPELPSGGPTLEGENWLIRLPLTDFTYE